MDANIGFSIVIPVYNCERDLERALASVEYQTLDLWEVVLVDDGSVDQSPEICQAFVAKHPDRSILITQRNRGPSIARAVGVRAATMPYVLCLDGDDELRSDALRAIAEEVSQRPWDVVQFNLCSDREFANVVNAIPWNGRREFEHEEVREVERVLFDGSSLNNLASKAVDRRILTAAMADASEDGLRMCEDFLVIANLLTRTESYLYLDESLYFYRPSLGSGSRKFDEGQYVAIRQTEVKYQELLERDLRVRKEPADVALRQLDKVYSSVTQLKYLDSVSFRRRLQFVHRIAADEFFMSAFLISAGVQGRLPKRERLVIQLLRSPLSDLVAVLSIGSSMVTRFTNRRANSLELRKARRGKRW